MNGVDRINVSLDTIIKDKYKEITRFGNLENVLDGIEEAKQNHIKVKINTVVFKNFNENEISELVNWANKKLIDITFIEVMPMNDTDMPRHMQFVNLEDIYKKLHKNFKFEKSIILIYFYKWMKRFKLTVKGNLIHPFKICF